MINDNMLNINNSEAQYLVKRTGLNAIYSQILIKTSLNCF